MVATKGNKRKSRNFYYRGIYNGGVEFVKNPRSAYTCNSKCEAEFLVTYLQRQIKGTGLVIKNINH